MIDIRTLEMFRAAVNHGSFQAAARELGISVSTLSVQMKLLEEYSGVLLFDRKRKPSPLTFAGREYIARVDEAIEAWRGLKDVASGDATEGRVHLGSVHTALTGLLPLALRQIKTMLPDVTVTLTPGLSLDLEDQLAMGSLDLALVSMVEPLPRLFTYIPIVSEELVMIAAPGQAGETIAECLASNPYLRFNTKTRVGMLINDAFIAEGLPPPVAAMELDALEGVVSMVMNGLGVSVIPLSPAFTLPKGLRQIRFHHAPQRQLGLVHPRIGRGVALAETFAECFRHAAAEAGTTSIAS